VARDDIGFDVDGGDLAEPKDRELRLLVGSGMPEDIFGPDDVVGDSVMILTGLDLEG
jgi:hypothetical protein